MDRNPETGPTDSSGRHNVCRLFGGILNIQKAADSEQIKWKYKI